eukprot:gene8773-6312_t
MSRDIPPYVKGYSGFGDYGLCFMENEVVILGEIEIGTPIEPPPTFKQPVKNARGFHSADGKAVLIADQEHHFDEVMPFKATTLKQFIDFTKYSSQNPTASLALAIPTLDRILQTSLKQLLFYFYKLGIGYVNGAPESVLLFRRLGFTQCSMSFANFEASFIISKADPPMTKGNCAVVNDRLPDHSEWIARVVCYSLLSNCPLPEASPTAGEPHQPYDPIAAALFHEGQKWYEVLRFTPYSRLREPLRYIEFQGFGDAAENEDEYFPAEHTVERYFYRYLVATSTWRAHSDLDRLAFHKMAATLVYLLHEDPAKRRFAIGIWCGNFPPSNQWTLDPADLQRWLEEPWEESWNAPRTFYLDFYDLVLNDCVAVAAEVAAVAWSYLVAAVSA